MDFPAVSLFATGHFARSRFAPGSKCGSQSLRGITAGRFIASRRRRYHKLSGTTARQESWLAGLLSRLGGRSYETQVSGVHLKYIKGRKGRREKVPVRFTKLLTTSYCEIDSGVSRA